MARKTKAKKKAKIQSREHLKNPRQIFDKHNLMFHTKNDYSGHWKAVKDKLPENDVLYRSIKHLQKPSVKTYADFIAFRVECLRSKTSEMESDDLTDEARIAQLAKMDLSKDIDTLYGVDINKSIEMAKQVLNNLKSELKELGLEAPNSLFELEERDRSVKAQRTNKRKLHKIDRLKKLLELKQVSLFDD